MKTRVVTLMLVLVLGALCVAPASAQTRAADEVMLQGELATLLVGLLGVRGQLPPTATVIHYIAVLMENGISPVDGWQPDEPVLRADLARVVVQAMRMESDVEDPDDPASWVALLESLGISLETVTQATADLEPLERPTVSSVFGIADSRDPLRRRRSGQPDEVQFGADVELIHGETMTLGDVERVFVEVTLPPVRRRAVTPD